MSESRLEGLEEVLNRLSQEISGIESRGLDGLWAAALEVEGKSKELVPVDTGNLRLSHRTEKIGDNSVAIDVQADYAVYVHEDMETPRKSGQPKFLQTALEVTDITGIIRAFAEVK